MPKIEPNMREKIVEFLPDAIRNSLSSYQGFCAIDPPEASKEFKAHHDACKVAVAHIELLIKLAKWADLLEAESDAKDEEKARVENLQELVEKARNEIDGYGV